MNYKCPCCNKIFSTHRTNAIYCSMECKTKSLKKNRTKICINCRSKFEIAPKGAVKKYCSHDCYVEQKIKNGLSLKERLEKYSMPCDSGCIEWRGALSKSGGYGVLNLRGKVTKAHRISYELANGKIPDDLIICHKCDNPKCINPKHLFPGTDKTNAIDASSKGRMHPGEKTANAILDSKKVLAIRESYRNGATMRFLAKEFMVSSAAIFKVIHRKTWAHV